MEAQLTTKIDKQNKHLELQAAINEMDSVVASANNLLGQIKGSTSPENDSPPRPVNSLENVLDGSAQEIRDKCSALHTTLDAIKLALF